MSGERDPVITEADIEKSSPDGLGPEYFAAGRVAERLVADVLSQETLDRLAKDVAKKVSDEVFNQISAFLWDGGIEHNMQLSATHMVKDVLEAVVSGNKVLASRIALQKYDQHGVRAAIAKLIPDEVLQARIADLEKEVEQLRGSLRWARM